MDSKFYKFLKKQLAKKKKPPEIFDLLQSTPGIAAKYKIPVNQVRSWILLMEGIPFKCGCCKKEMIYNWRGASRLHKVCIFCKQHLEFTILFIASKPPKIQTNAKKKIREKKTTKTKIIELLGDSEIALPQRTIARQLNLSISTISRNLKSLVKNKRVFQWDQAIKVYSLSKYPVKVRDKRKIPGEEKQTINAINTHNIATIFTILEGEIQTNFYRTWKLTKNTTFKMFRLKDLPGLNLRTSHKAVRCSFVGFGKNGEESLENIAQKSYLLKSFLEKKFKGLKLDLPVLEINNPHYVPGKFEKASYIRLKNSFNTPAYSDESHPGGTETPYKDLSEEVVSHVDRLRELENRFDKFLESNKDQDQQSQALGIQEIKDIVQTEMQAFRSELTSFKKEVVPQITRAIVDSFREMFLPGKDQSPQVKPLDHNYFE